MKTAILLLMLLAPGAVMAQSEVCDSSFTVNTVTISSFSSTLVDSAALTLPDRKWVEVQNVSRSYVQNIKLYSITTATNITGKVVLSQCK